MSSKGAVNCIRTSPWFSRCRTRTRKGFTPFRFGGRGGAMILALLSSSAFVTPGIAQTCPANIPHLQGVWRTLPYMMPINPISATLLRTG
jgi:hypothetical protein